MNLFASLKREAAVDWASYVDHEFVRRLGDGTLPEAAFRLYLVQDYLFLIHFARAYALAIYKSRNLADMRHAKASLSAILDTEMELHVALCGQWGITPGELEATPERQATVAYTRFVLDCGMTGDLLDLHVALAPCVMGYAEIARRLAPTGAAALGRHPYRAWIAEYAGEPYQNVAQSAQRQLDELALRTMTEARFGELAKLFGTASRLEADFWQMALDAGTRA
jgi:thiaminase/transcriptional activator TenA